MAGRAGRAGRPRGRAEHLARGRRTAETARSMRADWCGRARDDDGMARHTSSTDAGRGSTTRPGGKRSATEGGLGCGGGDGMRRRDELNCRAGLGDGGDIEDGGGGGEDRRVDRKVEDTGTVRYI